MDRDLTVLIPCAGRGERFKKAGYALPKPLIDVCGRPMLKCVIDNIAESADLAGIKRVTWVFVTLEEHDLSGRIREWIPDAVVFSLPKPTDGAARTCLVAETVIDADTPLLIANCDQIVDGGFAPLLTTNQEGAILTMKADGTPKWSYVETEGKRVTWVVEKEAVSDRATCGLYWWSRGRDFVSAAECMIQFNQQTNGEFYVAPTYNWLVYPHVIHEVKVESYGGVFHGLGTPEDLERYVKSHQ